VVREAAVRRSLHPAPLQNNPGEPGVNLRNEVFRQDSRTRGSLEGPEIVSWTMISNDGLSRAETENRAVIRYCGGAHAIGFRNTGTPDQGLGFAI
jgi:hypothetical protein